MKTYFLCVLLLACFSVSWAFRTQSVGVSGRLLCGKEPAKDILVKLIDQDNGPDPDDYLDQGKSNENGEFKLTGSTMELSIIDPEIRIFHDCNDRGRKCLREWVIHIPSKYIFDGSETKEFMNIGNINLEVQLESEFRECIEEEAN